MYFRAVRDFRLPGVLRREKGWPAPGRGDVIMLVSDYMTPDPFVVCRHEPVSHMVEVLRRHGIHQIPVTDSFNRLVGIVTDRDVQSAVGRKDAHTVSLLAAEIMTREVTTVTPATRLEDALDILSRERFGALPVVVGDRVVGMLSTRDLLKRFMELLKMQRSAMSPLIGQQAC